MKAPVSILIFIMLFTTSLKAQLEIVASSNDVINGIAVTSLGRIFVCFPHLEGGEGIRIGEVKGKDIVAYPNEKWNSWKKGSEVEAKIVRPNSIRIGPDGNLWIVDTGSPALGSDPLPGGAAKLIVVTLTLIASSEQFHCKMLPKNIRFLMICVSTVTIFLFRTLVSPLWLCWICKPDREGGSLSKIPQPLTVIHFLPRERE
jgi:hypothetical protein